MHMAIIAMITVRWKSLQPHGKISRRLQPGPVGHAPVEVLRS
jgi:hypothetical protein